jgi:hypothetical protein
LGTFSFQKNRQALIRQSDLYVQEHQNKHWDKIETAPPRYEIPEQWSLKLNELLQGVIILIRRTNNNGYVNILGHDWMTDSFWTNRLVRAEIKLNKNIIVFYQIRRTPNEQPLLNSVKYKLN